MGRVSVSPPRVAILSRVGAPTIANIPIAATIALRHRRRLRQNDHARDQRREDCLFDFLHVDILARRS